MLPVVVIKKYLTCPYCSKGGFISRRGLASHMIRSAYCQSKQYRPPKQDDNGYRFARDYVSVGVVQGGTKRKFAGDVGVDTGLYTQEADDSNQVALLQEASTDADEEFPAGDHREEGSDVEVVGYTNYPPSPPTGVGDNVLLGPNPHILSQFKDYCEGTTGRFRAPLCKDMKDAIRLLYVLRHSKASLGVYEEVMRWHFTANREMMDHQNLGDITGYRSRKLVFNTLFPRYNLVQEKWNIMSEIVLPSSRAKVKIVRNDAQAMMESLLSDPRITADDYLFFGDNPLSSPPVDCGSVLGDINTGLAYSETYRKLIKKPGQQVLVPVIFYIDSAATGQFADLPVTALKFTLGIFNRKAREKPHMWRTLGYVPKILADRSRGRRKFLESGHVDGVIGHPDMLHGEGNVQGSTVPPAQDLHVILAAILGDYIRNVQDCGFTWDLAYNGTVYEGIEFVPFTPFIKCDTEEADRLAGKYTSRGKDVSQLCRYCCCPTQECDQPMADYPRKTVPMIAQLVRKKDVEALRNMSQQNITNALYGVRFGCHNDEGIHGAAPVEMLHATLLGIFKYVRECFFDQIGESSALSADINAISVEIGSLFSRQSDRDIPKTQFSNGIRKGKLMAKEYTGVLLIIAALLRSGMGRQALSHKPGRNRGVRWKEGWIEDWVSLVETLLLWEEWLKSDQMTKNIVQRARRKHRYLMHLIRKVARRTQGMGLRILKFHAITHMAQDIIHFGVPMNFDTGADEAGHKPAKVAAQVTQKRKDMFEEQVSRRLTELHVLDLATEEIVRNRPVWNYFCLESREDSTASPAHTDEGVVLGGGRFVFTRDNVTGGHTVSTAVSNSDASVGSLMERPFIDFLGALSEKVANYGVSLVLRTSCYHSGVLYRASANYNGRPWRDWVVVNWGPPWGRQPAKIWGFVDLTELPPHNNVDMGGHDGPVPPSMYAIVENAEFLSNPASVKRSQLFLPICKEVGSIVEDRVVDMTYWLAEVEAFDEPISVIPNLGGPANSYFMLRKRCEWADMFSKWLEKPYETIPDDDSSVESDDSSA